MARRQCFLLDFEVGKGMWVPLYSERRTLSQLSFRLEAEEKEYELVEVMGPYPWWKVLLEILADLSSGEFLHYSVLPVCWYALLKRTTFIFA